MEGGGGVRPGAPQKPASPPANPPTPVNVAPTPKPAVPANPPSPTLKPATPTTAKPVVPATLPSPAKPVQTPTQIKPVPVNPKPVVNPITTPGPGTVKQLVNFYDSQGKASPIRPYSYSQSVKQG